MKKFAAVMTSVALGLGIAIGGVSPASAAVSTSMVQIQPLPQQYKVSSGYGYRTNPVTHEKGTLHRGLDYPAKCNTPILAVMDGKVVHSAWEEDGFGWYVQIQNNKTSAMYGHMIKKSGLKIGTKVYRGQVIGYVGSTGMSTGCHTHFELRDHTVKGKTAYGQPFNPTSKMKNLKNLTSPIVYKGSIGSYYKKHKSTTGYPRANEKKITKPNGYYQTFANGTVYYSSKSKSHFVKGKIKAKYKTVKYEKGYLGFPTSDQKTFKYNKKASYQNFQNGMIIYSSSTGGHTLKGAMKNKWKAAGWERSALKLPKGDEKCGLKNKGCYQSFQKGSIHWTSKTKAQITKGAIRTAWGKTKYEKGKLGYPTSGEFKSGSKTRQNFQGGYITWTSKTGAKVYYK